MLVCMHLRRQDNGKYFYMYSFSTCLSSDQLETYNKCWTLCKQSNAYNSNSLYNSVGQCYENICYLGEQYLIKIYILAFMVLLFIVL